VAGATTVGKRLDGLGYRLHALQKAREGAADPDRNAQFEHINETAAAFSERGQPVISVDTKKKELVGDFKNTGREWQPTGEPERVRVHDFPGDAVGKAIPYGVYDMARNEACIHVSHFPPGTSKWNKVEHRLFWSHHTELAWASAPHLRDAGRTDCAHADCYRTARQSEAR
jgi:Rhodopirellula transposase DDE domain